jgi:hypothetical protein
LYSTKSDEIKNFYFYNFSPLSTVDKFKIPYLAITLRL